MFLTVITRCCRRPKMLRDNVASVLAQTSRDWEQLFLVDRTGQHGCDPILWANRQFERFERFVNGEYVYPLDDDGVMVDNDVFERVQQAAQDGPDAILVKIVTPYYDGKLRQWPEAQVWDLDWEQGERPEKWAGNGYNIYTRSDIWREHLSHYQQHAGGDWHYITSLIEDDLYIKCVDAVSARSTMRGQGVIFEKCGSDWFDLFRREHLLDRLHHNVWRLVP